MRRSVFIAMMLFLSSCSGIDGNLYRDQKPAFDLKTYFNGTVKAWGIVQNRSGNIIKRFDVDIVGEWQDENGTLTEDFRYYDGTTQQRIWHITDLGQGRYEGRAADVIDKANSTVFGNGAQWGYVMDVPVGDTNYKIRFEDWMWLMNDGVLVNRSYMKKFGITVGEITIFMQKQPAALSARQ